MESELTANPIDLAQDLTPGFRSCVPGAQYQYRFTQKFYIAVQALLFPQTVD